MTRTKRVLACVMAALLALPLLCTTALAADPTYTFVVENGDAGYTYVLYQIFKGKPSTNGDGKVVLSDIEWGDGVKEDTKNSVYAMFNLTGDNRTAAKVAEKVAQNAGNDVFHSILAALGSNDGSSLQNGKTMSGPTAYNVTLNGTASQVTGYGATGLESGYYLVRNTVVPEGEGVTFSDYIVDVVGGDVKAEPKDASPSSAKKVQDVNDSLSATLSSGQDSADYDIGDTVPFTLTATLPTNYSNFSTVGYKLIFVDDLSAGFTWDGSATIYYGKDDTAGESVTFTDQTGQVIHTLGGEDITATSAYSGGKVWALDLGNLMASDASAKIKALKGGDTITVKYNATLNASAKVDDYGNRNSYRLYYSSNPTNWENVGSTTDDVNVVFTYKTVFNKVDENGAALTGADFTLEKFVADQNGTVTIDNIKGKWVNVTALHTGAGAVNPTKTGGATGSQFTFSGLDDGIYRLTETTTPAGYNKIDPIQFTITAEHEVQSEVAALKSLTGTSGADLTMTPSLPNASLTASVKNEPGIVLPATGGLGTVTLVAVGSGLAIVTFVVLITRRRLRVE